MKKQVPDFLQRSFLKKLIIESPNDDLAKKAIHFDLLILKRIMLLFVVLLFIAPAINAQDTGYYTRDKTSITIRTRQAPPPLPDYVQPVCPGDGYLWTPGYWSWATDDYYWVPGVWVMPPAINLLWTPGYWAFIDGFYGWYPGYWGSQVGYYGGINYGFGYFGTGFYGGRWDRGHFMYNTAVCRVGKNIRNTYVDKVNINIGNRNKVSFNGAGGVNYRPNKDELRGIQNHNPASKDQRVHEQNMRNEKGQFHNANPRPAIHSMSAPGGQRFDERGREMQGGRQGGGNRRGRG